ncbi:MAG: tannase/feruloyl esterase family alpha/beta hydrolase [Lachnospiraceae bacterium]|nr:tannase/feruloyl esterase family alpha/beta hydrolase [Lachnospiraceae bacterium]
MELKGKPIYQDVNHWMDLEGVEEVEGIRDKCTIEYLQKYLDTHIKMRDVTVAVAEVKTDGTYTAPNLWGAMGAVFLPPQYTDLPSFCNIEIKHKTGQYTETIWVWVPLKWNGRLFGCCGGGNRTAMFNPDSPGLRGVTSVLPLSNGFATVCSDGANREDEVFGWGIDWDKKEMKQELYQNWIRYSTHTMTVVAKAVVAALTGVAPSYSYIMGMSGGGRQVLSEAQNYPGDYDGYWSDCPCVSYNRMLAALSWPFVVMNTYKNTLPIPKLEAFKEAAWECAGGREAFFNTTERVETNPYSLVGKETEAGKITELDAKVMDLIWQGAQTEDGQFLWYGMRPGVEAWREPTSYCSVREENGEWKPVNFPMNDEYFKNWVEKNPDYPIEKLDIKEFTRLFLKCQELFPDMDTESPDLRELRDLGGKLILCHGTDDDAIYVDGTIAYYEKIINLFGGKENAKETARLFIVPGDGHGSYSKNGAGPSLATAMLALMDWVEKGKAPEQIHGQRFDMKTMSLAEEKDTPIY